MALTIVDSSVAAKWVLPEEDSIVAKQILVKNGRDRRPVILDLARAEIANAVFVRHLRGLVTKDEALAYFEVLRGLPVEIAAAHDLLPRAFQLSLDYRVSVYDALFVALVEVEDADGVTADLPLAQKVSVDFPRIKLLKNWEFNA